MFAGQSYFAAIFTGLSLACLFKFCDNICDEKKFQYWGALTLLCCCIGECLLLFK